MIRTSPHSTLFPYTTLFRSRIRLSGVDPPEDHFADRADPHVCRRLGVLRGNLAVLHRAVEIPPQHFDQHRRSEEHTSELQSRFDLVCRLLLEKKKPHTNNID